MNDFDLASLECAISLRERGVIARVSAVSVGEDTGALMHALAMGADDGVLLRVEEPLTSSVVAHCLVDWLKTQDYTILMMGKLGPVYESGQVPQRVAEALNLACIHQVIGLSCADSAWVAQCEEHGATTRVMFRSKAVLTSDLRLAEPRYPSFPNILRAKSKPLLQITAAAMHTDNEPRVLCLAKQVRDQEPYQSLTPEGLRNLLGML